MSYINAESKTKTQSQPAQVYNLYVVTHLERENLNSLNFNAFFLFFSTEKKYIACLLHLQHNGNRRVSVVVRSHCMQMYNVCLLCEIKHNANAIDK